MGDPVNSFDRSGLTCEVLLPDGTTFTATECVNVDADYPDDGWNNSFWNYFFLGSSPSPPRRQREHPAMPAADSS